MDDETAIARGVALSVVGGCFLLLLIGLGLTWIAQGNDFFLYKAFAPQYEQVRRETFEQSRAYNDGMVQELESMQFEYARANAEQKQALASIILHRAANYDLSKMPPDLRAFVTQLRQEATR